MKKGIIILFIITVVIAVSNQKSELLIPNESIRFRVIANSDSDTDQELKMAIKESVEQELNKLIIKAHNIDEARSVIARNLDQVKNIVNQYHVDYQINFGDNYFPTKEYKGVSYPAGDYESLVITLGKGNGKNWWCVMFPPLCLLEAEENNLEDVDYQFFVKKIIDKYL